MADEAQAKTAAALTIAGSDPSGGAGLQADLKTFHQHGVYGMAAVTLLTVQNTVGVSDVAVMDPNLVVRQIEAVVSDIPPAAAKTGALGGSDMIEAVAESAGRFAFPLVVDPVMASKHGHALLDDDAVEVLRARLLPKAFIVTPNIHEAARLTGLPCASVDAMEQAAHVLHEMGATHVVVKGGALGGEAMDVLLSDGAVTRLPGARIDSGATHGSGCVFAAAITARLALGRSVADAVAGAKRFVAEAIAGAPGLGGGIGPLDLIRPEA